MEESAKFQKDPHWRDLILFYEYFHGDNGAGLGASHQTGWTGLVAPLLDIFGRADAQTISRPKSGLSPTGSSESRWAERSLGGLMERPGHSLQKPEDDNRTRGRNLDYGAASSLGTRILGTSSIASFRRVSRETPRSGGIGRSPAVTKETIAAAMLRLIPARREAEAKRRGRAQIGLQVHR